MQVKLSKNKNAVMAVAGHAGCGHCHSHNQYIQDDSGGLAAALALFQEATGLSLLIKDIRVKTGLNGYMEVETESGGIGRGTALRGITFHEGRLARSLVGKEALRTQALVMEAFGRFYGQGAHECPVALQGAIANAALDSFVKNFPEDFEWGWEEMPGSYGLIAGAILEIDDAPVAVLGTVNASTGGIGPNEDLEGNSAAGSKGKVMARLGMLELPTVIVEGKVYTPKFCQELKCPTFLVRADEKDDNPIVAHSMTAAAKKIGYHVIERMDVMARNPGAMSRQVEELGDIIIELGEKLKGAEYAREKGEILAQLASIVSQDGGGVSFMSNKLNDIIGGVGICPGTGAVFSYLVPPSFYEEYIFPFITEEDLARFVRLVKASLKELQLKLPEAKKHLQENRFTEDLTDYIETGGA